MALMSLAFETDPGALLFLQWRGFTQLGVFIIIFFDAVVSGGGGASSSWCSESYSCATALALPRLLY